MAWYCLQLYYWSIWHDLSWSWRKQSCCTSWRCRCDGISENLEGVAVLILFGEGQTLTKAAKQAFKSMWKIRPMEVIGHRDVKSTQCPSDEVYNWIKAEGYKDRNKLPDTNEQPYQMLVCPSCSYKLKIC